MTTYFSDASFKFLRALARHNDKTWFNDHRHQYEAHVRQPFLQLITDLQPDLAQVSEHYRADPKTQGGSLFRIYRDARFSNDKSPYKELARRAAVPCAAARAAGTVVLHPSATRREFRWRRAMASGAGDATQAAAVHLR